MTTAIDGSSVRVGIATICYEDLGSLRKAEGGQEVHDPLHVKATVFVGPSGDKAAIITADAGAWRRGIGVTESVLDTLTDRCGLDAGNVTLFASHTHASVTPGTEEEQAAFAGRIADAVEEAADSARPAEVAYGQVDLGPGIIFNRRYLIDENYGSLCLMFNDGMTMRDDGVMDCSEQIKQCVTESCGGDWSDCGASKRSEIVAGTNVDSIMHLIAFREVGGGAMIGGLVRMTGHAVIVSTHWTKNQISADYPGYLCGELSSRLGGEWGFLQGPSGDSRPVHQENTFEACEAYGRKVAAIGASGISLDFSPLTSVACNTLDLRLPVNPATATTYDEAVRLSGEFSQRGDDNAAAGGPGHVTKRAYDTASFHEFRSRSLKTGVFTADIVRDGLPARPAVWRIGPAVVACMTGEVFTRTAQMMIARAPAGMRDRLVVCELANEVTEYMPTRQDFGLGGYEVSISCIAPGVSELAAELTLAAAKAL